MTTYRQKIHLQIVKYRVHIATLCIAILLCLFFLWSNIFISIRSGELGVLYSRLFGGTVMDTVYEEGMHVIFPWDIMYVYNVRVQEETQSLDVLTRDGLMVTIQISLRYQLIPDKLPILHKEIGPDYHRKIITPIINAAVRQTVGAYHPIDLYSTALQNLHDQILVDMVEELGPIPIIIHGVVVKNLHLPLLLNEAIERKLVTQQAYLRYKYLILEAEQEAKRKQIEGDGIRIYQALVNENMTPEYLQYAGIKATTELAKSNNAKMVIIGSGQGGLPLILNPDASTPTKPAATAPAKIAPPKATAPQEAAPEARPEATSSQKTPTSPKPTISQAPEASPTTMESFLEIMGRLDKTILSTK